MEAFISSFSLSNLENIGKDLNLPTIDVLFSLLEDVITILESENPDYRPVCELTGLPGGLLDFSSKSPVPIIVVPDLHARYNFLLNILRYKPQFEKSMFDGTKSIWDLLLSSEIKIICVGDGLHSELHKFRWLAAYNDFAKGFSTGDAMTQEMSESLALMQIVMTLKKLFPDCFHFLKGNHENILNSSRLGNHAFRKFVQEGEMVRLFMIDYYGEDILRLYSLFETSLPLCAICSNCIISHAEPLNAYDKNQLIDSLIDSDIILGLTWTSNGDSSKDSVKKMLKNLLPNEKNAIYFGGHRPVSENYALRQDGKFIQIHNPTRQNIGIVLPNTKFNPEIHIVSVV